MALLRPAGFRLTEERLPDGRDKIRILRAVDRARAFVPLRALLRFLRVSPSRFHAWRRWQQACSLILTVRTLARSRLANGLEVLALAHQLQVLRRSRSRRFWL